MSTYFQCTCPSCQTEIEYPDLFANTASPCPSCGQKMIFPPLPGPKGKSLVDKFIGFWNAKKEAKANQKLFRDEFLKAVDDGELTSEEVYYLLNRQAEMRVDDDYLKSIRGELLEAALHGAKRIGGVSPEKYKTLKQLETFLNFDGSEIQGLLQEIERERMIWRVRNEPLATIDVINVVLRKGEKVYRNEPASLYEERVVSRRYEGGSRGVRVRVMKGVSFTMGASRGQMISERDTVPVCSGEFLITSHRLIYNGGNKSFETKLDKIIGLNPFIDGLRYSESGRQKPRLIKFASLNGDIIMEILSRVIEDYGNVK